MIVDRPIAERTRAEIEKRIAGMGDYVKMSYLQRALKSGLDFDARRFVLLTLGKIYEERKMFLEAARIIKAAAEINITFKDKMRDFMRAVELNIKAGDYAESDRIFAQALALGNTQEKFEIKMHRKNYYLKQGKELVSKDKRNNAKLIYEKLLTLELAMNEKKEAQNVLLELYKRLGNIRDYYNLKGKIDSLK